MIRTKTRLPRLSFATGLVSCSAVGLGVAALPAAAIEQDDLVLGLSNSDPLISLELVRGEPVENGGSAVPDFWDEPFIQSVEFDNLNGISHNPQGNLLGLNFGLTTGTIVSMGTTGEPIADQIIGDTEGLGGGGLTVTRLGGLSVSPGNTKIAVAGYDSGKVIVYDYTPGDTEGGGASLSGARETADTVFFLEDTQGTAWFDDNTVIAFATSGEVRLVDATTMSVALVGLLDTIDGGGPGFTDVEYNAEISPYIYAMYSAFTGETRNLLFVLDPTIGFQVVGTFDYSVSMDTTREIALDSQGNLFASQFGAAIDVILDAKTLGSLDDDNSIDWYTSENFAAFSGLDIALGEAGGEECVEDLDGSGEVDFADILEILTAWGNAGGPEDLDGSGTVDFGDILAVLTAWGPCP